MSHPKDAFRGQGGKKTPIASSPASTPEGAARIAAHRQALSFEERVAAVAARARFMTINTVDLTNLYTVEIGGQDEDVIITEETARYLYGRLGDFFEEGRD